MSKTPLLDKITKAALDKMGLVKKSDEFVPKEVQSKKITSSPYSIPPHEMAMKLYGVKNFVAYCEIRAFLCKFEEGMDAEVKKYEAMAMKIKSEFEK